MAIPADRVQVETQIRLAGAVPKQYAGLGLLLGATWLAGLLATAFLLNRLIVIVHTYDTLLARDVVQKDLCHQTEVLLRSQVQEWQTILLSASDPTEREASSKRLFQLEWNTVAGAQNLRRHLGPNDRQVIDQFLILHSRLETHYRMGLDLLARDSYRNVHEVDGLVRGEADPPLELLEELVRRLDLRMEAQKADISASLRMFGYGLAVTFLSVLALYVLIGRALAAARAKSTSLAESLMETDGRSPWEFAAPEASLYATTESLAALSRVLEAESKVTQ